METDKLVRYFGSTSEQILTWSWRAGILFLWCWSLNLCANKLSIHAQNFKGLFLQIVTPWNMHTVSLSCHLRSRNGTSLIHPWSHFSRWETYWFFFVVVFAASPMSPFSSLGSAPGTTILVGRCDSDDWTARTWCVFFFEFGPGEW